MNYIVKAYNKMNNELVRIKRDSKGKAINTAHYWLKKGAKYIIIEDEEYNRIAWID